VTPATGSAEARSGVANEALIEVRNLRKEYRPARRGLFGKPPSPVVALKDASLAVAAGETVGIVGESGSGKTTLGQCIAGLLEPTSGEVRFTGTPVADLSPALHIQPVFQDPVASLNPRRRVGSMLEEILRVHRLRSGAEVGARAAELLQMVGLDPRISAVFPGRLSGGQCQRVAIARALAFEPELIIADEAVSALDVAVQAQVLNVLKVVQQRTGMAMVFITHNLAIVRYVCHRVIVMREGEIVEVGPVEDVISRPQHPYSRELVESILDLESPHVGGASA
jgi:ABC-type glutathione transport system ATPase component